MPALARSCQNLRIDKDARRGGMHIQIKGSVPVQLATLVALICFGLGVLLASYLFIGSDIPLKCYEAGSDADWWAAGGTWVIGIGAIMYSARELGLKIHERREARVAELASTLGQYSSIAYTAMTVRGRVEGFGARFVQIMRDADQVGRAPEGLDSYFIAPIRGALGQIKWDRSIGVPVADKGLARLGAATYYAERSEAALAYIASSLKQAEKHGFGHLVEMAKEVEDLLDALAVHLASIPDALQTDADPVRELMERLQRRIAQEDAALLGE